MAWYNKYRPQTFEDVVGQNLVKTVLQNALQKNIIKHAYLLSGPKGTGKTTLARIFAKSLNQVDQNPQSSIDIIEMDAASNTGIDDIRQLIEQSKNPPISGKYKIYIIDEVHMLSKAAMNALLKILEEPPTYLIFLLATTNPEKLIPTVLSRLTKLQLTNHSLADLVSRLTYICQQESLTVSPEALELIAKRSNGGQRDAINLLETVSSYNFNEYTEEIVASILGVLPSQQILQTAQALLSNDVNQISLMAKKLSAQGVDGDAILSGLLEWLLDESLSGKTDFDDLIVPISEVISLRLPLANVASALMVCRAYLLKKKVNFLGNSTNSENTAESANSKKLSSQNNIQNSTNPSLDLLNQPVQNLQTADENHEKKDQAKDNVEDEIKNGIIQDQTTEVTEIKILSQPKNNFENLEITEKTELQVGSQNQPDFQNESQNKAQKNTQPEPENNSQINLENVVKKTVEINPEISSESNLKIQKIDKSVIANFVHSLASQTNCPPSFKMLSPDLDIDYDEVLGTLTLSVSSGIFQTILNAEKLKNWIISQILQTHNISVQIQTKIRLYKIDPNKKQSTNLSSSTENDKKDDKQTLNVLNSFDQNQAKNSPQNSEVLQQKSSAESELANQNPVSKLIFLDKSSQPNNLQERVDNSLNQSKKQTENLDLESHFEMETSDNHEEFYQENYQQSYQQEHQQNKENSQNQQKIPVSLEHENQKSKVTYGKHFYRLYKRLPENMEDKGVEVKHENVILPSKKPEKSFEEEAEEMFEFE